MKLSGAVRFFAIALAVVCLFQLSFTFCARQIEGNARSAGEAYSDPIKRDSAERRYLDSVSRKPVYNLGIIKYNYVDVKEKELNFGLDLQGGMHVTLQVATADLIRSLASNPDDTIVNRALAVARQRQMTIGRNYVDLFVEALRDDQPNIPLRNYFINSDNRDAISRTSSDGDVIEYLKAESKSALDRTYNILYTRVDKFGVTQPNIQLDQDAGRIIVELPGVDEPARVRKLLQGTAALEFYETYPLVEVFPLLREADSLLQDEIVEEKGGSDVIPQPAATVPNPVASLRPAGDTTAADSGMAMVTDTGTKLASTDTAAAKAAAESRPRPLLQALFPTGIPQDAAQSPVAGYVRATDTALVNRMLSRKVVKDALPEDLKFLWSNKPYGEEEQFISLVALRTTGIAGAEAALGGEVIQDARADISPQGSSHMVNMRMNTDGANSWAEITRRNIGKAVAIVLDDQVYSFPNVQNEINGGSSQITGNFTAREASDLANVLKAGKLPVGVNIIEEGVVGPSLGAQNITRGVASLLAGLITLVIFMALYYNRSGLVANVALIINLFFLIGILTSLQAALTLPGMAGIVLTLAIALDANVLIYERVREELKSGKGLRLAIQEGFNNALSSIIDGNICNLLVGIILLYFGSGPIYGFAVVLVIGICTSLFCSILVTRMIFEWMLKREQTINFGNKVSYNMLSNFNFDFIGKRKLFYGISATVIAIGIASLIFQGLNYGVDFAGGTTFTVQFDGPISTEAVRTGLTDNLGSSPEVKTFGGDNKLAITTKYLVDDPREGADDMIRSSMEAGLAELPVKSEILQTQKVSSTVATDIRSSAVYSIIFGLLVIFVYIIARFRRWQFALGATLALIHDVLIVLTIFSLFKDVFPFSLDMDQNIIAALLTLIGYSLNDTVVVFDRIREYIGLHKRTSLKTNINNAINQTLSRTLITSFTIFVVVLILFLFGGEAIRGFAFAMLIGILVGTYSSIFVATPVVVDLQNAEDKRKQDQIEGALA